MTWRIVHDTLLIGRHNASAVAPANASGAKRKVAAFDLVRGCTAGRCLSPMSDERADNH